jgi:hypothetical protein
MRSRRLPDTPVWAWGRDSGSVSAGVSVALSIVLATSPCVSANDHHPARTPDKSTTLKEAGPSSVPSVSSGLEGRYIVYLGTSAGDLLADKRRRAATLKTWESRLGASIRLERQLATGGWVVTVIDRSTSPAQQQHALETLEGVSSVERDAIMIRPPQTRSF